MFSTCFKLEYTEMPEGIKFINKANFTQYRNIITCVKTDGSHIYFLKWKAIYNTAELPTK